MQRKEAAGKTCPPASPTEGWRTERPFIPAVNLGLWLAKSWEHPSEVVLCGTAFPGHGTSKAGRARALPHC